MWLFRGLSDYSECLARSLFSELSELLVSQLCNFQTLPSTHSSWGWMWVWGVSFLSRLLESHPGNILVLNQRLEGTTVQISEAPSLSSSTFFLNLPGRRQLLQQNLSPVCWPSLSKVRLACSAWAPPPRALVRKVPRGRCQGDSRALPCSSPLSGISPVLFVV